jgi:hypothetical protein
VRSVLSTKASKSDRNRGGESQAERHQSDSISRFFDAIVRRVDDVTDAGCRRFLYVGDRCEKSVFGIPKKRTS